MSIPPPVPRPQYDSPGFVPNVRQHRQFGCGALELQQLLRHHWASLRGDEVELTGSAAASYKAVRGWGLITRDSTSSMTEVELGKYTSFGPKAVHHHDAKDGETTAPDIPQGYHRFCWRDAYDVLVRWRQASEPFDPVWWIDRFTAGAFGEGFGLQTPMVRTATHRTTPPILPVDLSEDLPSYSFLVVPPAPPSPPPATPIRQLQGQTRVHRYYPCFPEALDRTKQLLADTWPLTDEIRDNVMSSKTIPELFRHMRRDFFVISPCFSTTRPSHHMEGTHYRVW